MDIEKLYTCDVCKEKKDFAIAFLYPEGEMIICVDCLIFLTKPFLLFNSILDKEEEM